MWEGAYEVFFEHFWTGLLFMIASNSRELYTVTQRGSF